jgi:hypothetical protein
VENLYVPHVRYISMKSTAENAYDVLDMIGTISNDRGALFSSLGIKDFVDYNSNDEIRRRVEAGELPHVPQIYFLIDEYITMLSGGVGGKKKNAADNDLDERLRDLLQRVRSSGVGVIFSGQRSEFSGDTLGLIGNRISFDPGHENLFNKMFTFDFAKEDSGALYRRIRGRIGTAVSARKDGTKKVVRTAFSGQQMKNRQLALAKAIRENGLYFMYHNHDQEFKRLQGKTVLRKMAEDFTPEELGFVLDTFWIQAGGANPVEYIREFAGRVPCIHLKDYAVGRKMAPIGEGNINFEAVVAACEYAGAEYLLVEQDDCNGEDPFDCMKRSYDYLKSLGLE